MTLFYSFGTLKLQWWRLALYICYTGVAGTFSAVPTKSTLGSEDRREILQDFPRVTQAI